MRKAIVAGQFYPRNTNELKKQVLGFLKIGERKEEAENVKIAIVPHAGYMFSGRCAGEVFSLIGKEKTNFIILGVNHSGFGNKVCFSEQDFETPLGVVGNNIELGEKILKKIKEKGVGLDADVNEKAHAYEHSIEVELPFLQLKSKKARIVPILLRELSYEECKKLASILAEFLDKTFLLVSSDFTHYGYSYRFLPFRNNVKENLYKLDKNMIGEIVGLNSMDFYKKASRSTVCGIYGVTVCTEIAKIKRMSAKLVDYYTSGDIVGDFDNAVGYAGVVFS